MLRVLILAMAVSMLGAVAWASIGESAPAPKAADVDRAAEQARSAVRQALDAPPVVEETRRALDQAQPASPAQAPRLNLPVTSTGPTEPMLTQPEPRAWDVEREPTLLVLVSFSMPATSLKALAAEARRVGASLVLRGLVNDSFPDTLSAIHKMAGAEAATSGFAIDPTLFTRFGVQAVPTYVLLLEPLQTCTSEHCKVPRHLRLSGEAGLRHVLETMGRGAEPAVSGVVETLIARLEKAP